MSRFRSLVAPALAATLSVAVGASCRDAPVEVAPTEELGPPAHLGGGTIRTFARLADDGAPVALGVVLSAGALTDLPVERSDRHRCFDLDGDGEIEEEGECLPTHERVLPLPTSVSARADIPFKWMLFNWNPVGHAPPHIYDRPHFDVHFYMEPIENVFALMPGPCGPELIRCDQFEVARRAVPSEYVPGEFQNVDAVAPAMGNHLIDLTGDEFHGRTFDRSWIYGAYDGRIIFWEEMVALEFLRSRPDRCYEIKTPVAYETGGYYPTRVCYRPGPDGGDQRLSLEGFVHRAATPRTAGS